MFSQDWISRSEAWSFWEAVAGSLSVAMTAVSSANVAVMESGEVGRSALYRRYSKGPRGKVCEFGVDLYDEVANR
jgi:hypothetical protein